MCRVRTCSFGFKLLTNKNLLIEALCSWKHLTRPLYRTDAGGLVRGCVMELITVTIDSLNFDEFLITLD